MKVWYVTIGYLDPVFVHAPDCLSAITVAKQLKNKNPGPLPVDEITLVSVKLIAETAN